MGRVALIGLDCAAPGLLFDRYRGEMPHLDALMRSGGFGRLRSCDPPITVPAWACLFSGRDPGELGVYGFRNRRTRAETSLRISSADAVQHPSVWDVLAAEGGDAILLGIPPSYPALPVRGCRVSCLLTPTAGQRSTWPPELAVEIERVAPDYVYDVGEFRGAEPFDLLQRLQHKTENHFRVARHLLRTRPWDLFAMVEMGPDRLHHALWRYIDPGHPAYQPGTEVEMHVVDYFRRLDAHIGELLDVIGSDAVVIVASDHGAQPMRGGVCVNEWLRRNGYLVLHETPSRREPLRAEAVDWARTTAWAEGGYYARVFLNQRDREPLGCVEPDAGEGLLDEIAAGLAELTDRDGCAIGVAAHRPRDLYREVRGVAPDLIVYFGGLGWRSLGGVGGAELTSADNDGGADDANHDWDGVFIMRDKREPWQGEVLSDLSLLDVGATILDRGGFSGRGVIPGRPVGRRNTAGASAFADA